MIAGNEWLDIQNLKKDKFRINDCREWTDYRINLEISESAKTNTQLLRKWLFLKLKN